MQFGHSAAFFANLFLPQNCPQLPAAGMGAVSLSLMAYMTRRYSEVQSWRDILERVTLDLPAVRLSLCVESAVQVMPLGYKLFQHEKSFFVCLL